MNVILPSNEKRDVEVQWLGGGGGGGAGGGHNAALCLHRTASCGVILAHMHAPPPSSAMDGGSVLWPHISHFST